MIFGAETVNLYSGDRTGMSPNNDTHVSTSGGGAHAVGDWVRHMRWIVRHKIYAVAATATLTDRAQMLKGIANARIKYFCRSAL